LLPNSVDALLDLLLRFAQTQPIGACLRNFLLHALRFSQEIFGALLPALIGLNVFSFDLSSSLLQAKCFFLGIKLGTKRGKKRLLLTDLLCSAHGAALICRIP